MEWNKIIIFIIIYILFSIIVCLTNVINSFLDNSYSSLNLLFNIIWWIGMPILIIIVFVMKIYIKE